MQNLFTTESTEGTEQNLKLGILSSAHMVANSPSNCPHRASLWTEKIDRRSALSRSRLIDPSGLCQGTTFSRADTNASNHRALAPAKSVLPGAKAQVLHDWEPARLKPCPDTSIYEMASTKTFSVLSVSSVVNVFSGFAIDHGARHQEQRPCF